MSDEIHYPDHFIQRLHTIWGDGFLSPGGPEEVSEIIRNEDLTGKEILDIGFGTGGPGIHIAKTTQAAKIVGIDVESQLLEEAARRAERAGVRDRMEFRIVEPGPLPFADNSFDMVFSKDSIIHIPDKATFYAEAFRVLKPGGQICFSDWLGSSDPGEQEAMEVACSKTPLDFNMVSASETEAMLKLAGFSNVASRDRNAWFADQCMVELEAVKGPLYDELVNAVGKDIVDPWISIREALAEAAASGGLRPSHVFGQKPNV